MRCRRIERWGVALSLAVAAWGVSPGPIRAEETTGVPPRIDIDWYYSLEQGLARAAEIGRQAAVVFYTNWCPWCRAMDDSTFSNPLIAPVAERIVFTRVNAENDTAAAHGYRVRAYPTVIIMTAEGKEVDRLVGYLPPDAFRQTMIDYLDGKGTYWDVDRQLKKDPKDPSLVFALAEKFTARGEFESSRDYYRKVLSLDEDNKDGWSDNALFALARLYREEGQWYKAAESFRRMTEAYPDSELRPDADAYIPWLYEQAGDTVQALKHYRAFLKTYKGSPDQRWVEERVAALTPPTED